MFYNQPFSNSYYDKIKNLSLKDQLFFFQYCYGVFFIKEHSDYAKECESKKTLSIEHARKYKMYDELNKQLLRFIDVLEEIVNLDVSVNEYYKTHKHKFINKRNFYVLKKKFIYHFAKLNINFEAAFLKSRAPKTVRRGYDQRHRNFISQFVSAKIEEGKMNFLNIWLHLCKDDEINKHYNFRSLAYNTMMKIFYQENNISRIPRRIFRTEHNFRDVVRKPGNVQADVKVFGLYETNVGRKVRVFVVRDIATRLTYTKTLKRETSEEIIQALEESRNWFKRFGIKIRSIQTDNAMVFKTTNFVYSGLYLDWCRLYNIKARHIRLKHPESNGIVESFNGMIDKEWHAFLIDCTTWEEVDRVVKEMTHIYNFERYATFGELKNKKYGINYRNRYVIPARSVQLISNLYNLFESNNPNK